MRCSFLIIGAVALATACADRSALPTVPGGMAVAGVYQVVDLGALANPNPSGGHAGQAWDINDAGHVVGESQTLDGASHAFLFDGVVLDLGTLGGDSSVAEAINELGHVAGVSKNAAGEWRAFLWDGAMHDLGPFYGPFYPYYVHTYLNNHDQVAWTGATADGSAHAFLWDSGTVRDLGTLGGSGSGARGIDDSAQVIGLSRVDSTYTQHGFRWANGVMTDLGRLVPYAINTAGWIVGTSPWGDTIPPSPNFATLLRGDSATNLGTLSGHHESIANAVNNRGTVAGVSLASYAGDYYYPFVWEDGAMRALDPAYPYPWHQTVVAINEDGFVIGKRPIDAYGHAYQAAVWEPDGTGQNLGSLGGEFSYANAINEQGTVVGWAETSPGGERRPVLWLRLTVQVAGLR